jgi:hypothetical protein
MALNIVVTASAKSIGPSSGDIGLVAAVNVILAPLTDITIVGWEFSRKDSPRRIGEYLDVAITYTTPGSRVLASPIKMAAFSGRSLADAIALLEDFKALQPTWVYIPPIIDRQSSAQSSTSPYTVFTLYSADPLAGSNIQITGPVGPDGPQGPVGPTGPAGSPAPTYLSTSDLADLDTGTYLFDGMMFYSTSNAGNTLLYVATNGMGAAAAGAGFFDYAKSSVAGGVANSAFPVNSSAGPSSDQTNGYVRFSAILSVATKAGSYIKVGLNPIGITPSILKNSWYRLTKVA